MSLESIKTAEGGHCHLANHKSALKRARQAESHRLRNLAHKTKAKSAVKGIKALLADKKIDEAKGALNRTVSILQGTASKHIIPKKRASRKISRIARAVNRAASQKTT
jgi:small subunit ribosomal protein S20